MGSFFARQYAATYPETISALLLSGTGGSNPAAGVGIFITKVLGKIKGPQYRSQFVNNLAFGAYLKHIENPDTPYDWITRDKDMVRTYAADPKCTFVFTVSAFQDLLSTLKAVSGPQWAQRIDKKLPVLLFSGDQDPVGDYGKGVREVYRLLQEAGVQDVTIQLYEGGRHEMLNETNRQNVYNDVLSWCLAHIPPKQ
jgi:alpha-beta hydrolase superfamily lysophospholipase